MRFIKWALLLLAVWSGLASAQVNAQEEHLVKIFRGVMRNEIPLTLKVHEQFWSKLGGLSTSQRADFVRMTTSGLVEAHAYQVEVWDSALLSFQRHKVYKSGKMSSLEREMRSTIQSSLPNNPSDDTMRASIEAFEAKYQEAIQNSNLVLEVAAKHQVLHLPGMPDIEMNEESIRSIAASLKETSSRVQRLLNPVWIDGSQSRVDTTPLERFRNGASTIAPSDGEVSVEAMAPVESLESKAQRVANYNAQISTAVQASIIRPTDRRLFDAGLEQANFETRIREEARPTGWESFGAAVAGSTQTRIVEGFKDRLSSHEYPAVPGFKPDLKNLPPGADSDVIAAYGTATSPQAAEKVLSHYEDEQLRKKTVRHGSEGVGIAMSIGLEVCFLAVLGCLAKLGASLLHSPKRST